MMLTVAPCSNAAVAPSSTLLAYPLKFSSGHAVEYSDFAPREFLVKSSVTCLGSLASSSTGDTLCEKEMWYHLVEWPIGTQGLDNKSPWLSCSLCVLSLYQLWIALG